MKSWKSIIEMFTAVSLFFLILVGLFYIHKLSDTKQLTSNDSHLFDIVKKLRIPHPKWKGIFVKKYRTLVTIVTHLKVNQSDLLEPTKQHTRDTLNPKKILYFQIKPFHQLIITLKYLLSCTKPLTMKEKNNHVVNVVDQEPIITTLNYKSIIIQHSLSQDGKKLGLTYRTQKELQSIFGGQINFSHDIHCGDRFAFLYQARYRNNKKFRSSNIGNIIAAEFSNRRKTYQAIRYTYPIAHTAYYTPEGHEVKAQFLRMPLHYTRISSYFSYHRLDPILHKVRPHLGLDFAAPQGTPIKSIGEGRVIFIGQDGGYGKTIKIRYSQHYLALYAHLSHFSKIKVYQWVHRGQIIGEVGRSGWATGPHLHFGFFINGKPKNWLAMKPLSTEQSVPYSYENRFHKEAKKLLAELHLHQDTKLATNNIKHLN